MRVQQVRLAHRATADEHERVVPLARAQPTTARRPRARPGWPAVSTSPSRRHSGDGAGGGGPSSRAWRSASSAASRFAGSRKAAEPASSGRERRGLGLHRLQPLDVLLVLAQGALGIAARAPGRAAPRAARCDSPRPASAAIAALTLRAPRVHLLRDGGGDLGQEVVELGRAARRRRRSGRIVLAPAPPLRPSPSSPSSQPPRRPAVLACSGRNGLSLTAWKAISRFSAPSSSRTLSMSSAATASSTPVGETARAAPRPSRAGSPRGSRSPAPPTSMMSPPREPPDQPLVQRLDLGRRPVARQDDLAAAGLQRVGEPQQLACISRRWVRNWTSSTSSRSTSRKRLR